MACTRAGSSRRSRPSGWPPPPSLAIGDDRTDEDLFDALPPEAITIRVGPGPTKARFRLDGVAAVRQLLHSLVETRRGGGAGAALSADHHAHRDPRRSRRARARSRHRRGESADPPVHHLRARGRRLASARLHLRAERQPQPRGAGACARGARRGRDVALAFASGMAATAAVFQSLAAGRPRRSRRRTPTTAPRKLLREVLARWGLASTLRGHDRSRHRSRAASPRAHGCSGSRRPSNPRSRSPTSRAIAAIARDGGRALRVRQHLGHARAPASARARRRSRDALDDQVPGRAQRRDRRRAGAREDDELCGADSGRSRPLGGAVPSPFDCWLVHARDPHAALPDARALRERGARWRASSPGIRRSRWCTIPGSPTDPGHAVAARQMTALRRDGLDAGAGRRARRRWRGAAG